MVEAYYTDPDGSDPEIDGTADEAGDKTAAKTAGETTGGSRQEGRKLTLVSGDREEDGDGEIDSGAEPGGEPEDGRDAEPEPPVDEPPVDEPMVDEPAENLENCGYIHETLARELRGLRFYCAMSEEYPHNITLSSTDVAAPCLVIMRRRNGGYIAGLSGDSGVGDFIRPEDLPILRSDDREEVLDHARRYVRLTTPKRAPQPAPRRKRSRLMALAAVMVIAAVSIVCTTYLV